MLRVCYMGRPIMSYGCAMGYGWNPADPVIVCAVMQHVDISKWMY